MQNRNAKIKFEDITYYYVNVYYLYLVHITDMTDNTNFQHDLDIKVENYHLDQCEEILGLVSDTTKISASVTYTEDGMLFQLIAFKKVTLFHKLICTLMFDLI